jgi:predicted  nucleic acid-binding Zn-ribbon protein
MGCRSSSPADGREIGSMTVQVDANIDATAKAQERSMRIAAADSLQDVNAEEDKVKEDIVALDDAIVSLHEENREYIEQVSRILPKILVSCHSIHGYQVILWLRFRIMHPSTS